MVASWSNTGLLRFGFPGLFLSGAMAFAQPSDQQIRAAAGCDDCLVLNVSRLHFEEITEVVWDVKLGAVDLSETFTVGLLDDGVSQVNPADYIELDRRVAAERRGAMSKDLALRIAELPPSEVISVQILTKFTRFVTHDPELLDTNPGLLQEWDEEVNAQRTLDAAPVLEWLAMMGVDTEEQTMGPLIHARMSVELLTELAWQPSVTLVDYDPGVEECATTAWGDTLSLSEAIAISQRTGVNPAICLLELDLPRDGRFLEIAEFYDPNASSGTHGQYVAGFIRNTFKTGAAQAASIHYLNLSAFRSRLSIPTPDRWCATRYLTTQPSVNTSSLVNPNNDILPPTAGDLAEDYLQTIPPWMVFVRPAGNGARTGAAATQHRGALVVVVGASDNNATSTPTDDFVAPFSGWVNPITPHRDRETPTLVAPGADQVKGGLWWDLPAGSYYLGQTGTSISTPIVAGIVAQLHATNAWSYRWWPEATRATLVAAAHTRIDRRPNFFFLPQIDTKDGFGLLNAETAMRIATKSVGPGNSPVSIGHFRGTLKFSRDFDAQGVGRQSWLFRAPADGRLRVALAFESWASSQRTYERSDDPLGDLDLVVRQLFAAQQCVSSSFDSLIEYCEIDVKGDDVFEISFRLPHYKLGGGPLFTQWPSTKYGVAWTFIP